MNTNTGVRINRKVKDSLFRRIFGIDKKNALSLYNALNGSDYFELEDLQYTTLDDVVYMKMKNDLSFLICFTELNLFEQQSTYNPNMPLRGFLYFADLYRQLLPDNESIYGKRLVKIPTPKYIVLYNGNERDMPEDERKLRLSDAFEDCQVAAEFEWTATVLNINIGHNKQLLERCKSLKEYSIFTSRIRENALKIPMAEAIEKAMEDCIREGILKDLLEKNQREVKNMCLTEFDEERYRQICREESLEEGREEGRKEGREEGMHAFIELCKELDQSKEDTVKRFVGKFSLTAQQAQEYMDKYWE